MAMQLVQSGFGASFLPESIVKTMPHSGIYAKAIRGLSERFYVVLAYDDKAYHSGSVERFLHFEEEDTPA
jgi:DNA-binding transcriptional LysR family regulator